jgi:predicted small lipoprotein YifL
MCALRRGNGYESSKRKNPDFALIVRFDMVLPTIPKSGRWFSGQSMRKPKIQGAQFLSQFRDATFMRLALIGAFVAAFALAGCGRKGPLDPPPSASLAGEPQGHAPAPLSSNGQQKPIGGEVRQGEAGIDHNGQPVAAKGQRKHIPLDVLLN